MSDKVVFLMRGLPSCGKSHTAKILAGDRGVVLETDQYFYTEVGNDPTKYEYSEELLPAARAWNFQRFQDAISSAISPIVVDRGNGLNKETQNYARYAVDHDYRVELKEADSPWWQELRVLLKHKHHVAAELFDQFADALAAQSRTSHRVPVSTIRRWMAAWKYDLTVQEILDY